MYNCVLLYKLGCLCTFGGICVYMVVLGVSDVSLYIYFICIEYVV